MGYGDIEEMKEELEDRGEFFEKDIYCPYCFHKQDICELQEAHEESDENIIKCESCNNEIEFDTRVDVCYYIRKKDNKTTQ